MFGERIKELRSEKNWTQADLAAKIQCNQRTVSRYEQEKIDLSTDVIIRLCHLFKVSADYLLGLEDETGAKI